MTYGSNQRTQNIYTDEQLQKAQDMVEVHNKSVRPCGTPFCEKGQPGYLIIDVTGAKRVYFTLYRYNNLTLPGKNPYSYIKNISTDLIKSVESYCTGKGLPVIINTDDNFNPKQGGVPVLGFGKHKGLTLDAVYDIDPNYVMWIANKFDARNAAGRKLKEHSLVLKEAHYQLLTETNKANCVSKFQGTLKQRLNFTLTVYNVKPACGDSSPKYKAVDKDGNLFYFWCKNVYTKDQVINVKGTVVDHKELLGKEFTRINRVANSKVSELRDAKLYDVLS